MKKYKVTINKQVSSNTFTKKEALELMDSLKVFPKIEIKLVEVLDGL